MKKLYDLSYVARQPILDRDLKTYGYELLYRSQQGDTVANIKDEDLATIKIITDGFIRGQENIEKTRRLFINFTQKLLLEGAARSLLPGITIIEVLEDVQPLPAIIDELISLKQEGYLIAIDDYEEQAHAESLLKLADIIKVDILGKSKAQIAGIYDSLQTNKALKLCEKVESQEIYLYCRELGFDLFQGYFFAKPENLQGREPTSYLASKLRILQALNEEDIETDTMVSLVTQDPSISYRLMRLVNSAAFGFSMEISSIQHAVTLLGRKRLQYWLRMIVLSDMKSATSPDELLLLALHRGKTLEELAMDGHLTEYQPESGFLFGMFSLLDVVLDTPFPTLFASLPLPNSFKRGYLEPDSPTGRYLALLQSIEQGDQQTIVQLCQQLAISPQSVYSATVRATLWTDSIAEVIL